MTDTMVTLVWCAVILLVFCACGATAETLLRRRDHRRAVAKQLRRVRAHTMAAPSNRDAEVIELRRFSVRVPDRGAA